MSGPPTDGDGEFRRGWPIVLVSAIGCGFGLSPLTVYTISVFTKPIAAAFDWSRAEVQGVFSFFILGALVGSPVWGRLIDRWGARRTTLVSLVGLSAGFAAIAFATRSLASFYGLAFVTAVAGAATTPVSWSRAVLEWFAVRRGLALGIALSGTGITAAFGPTYVTWLIGKGGWQAGYLGLALLPGLVSLPLVYLFLHSPSAAERSRVAPPEDAAGGVSFRQAVRGYRFWAIGVAFFILSLGVSGVLTHLVPLLTDRGYSPEAAARILAFQGLAVIFGRIATGFLLDRFWAPGVAAVVCVAPALSCFMLAGDVLDPASTAVALVIMGFTSGAEFDLMAYLVARYFGTRNFGAIYGALFPIIVSAAGVAAPLSGWVFDVTGGYKLVLFSAAACYVLSPVLILGLGRYPKCWPIREPAPIPPLAN